MSRTRPGAEECPGVTEYGRGLTTTTVHGSDCCREWGSGHTASPARAAVFRDAVERLGSTWPRPERAAEPEPEVG
jgi:hypothetical protein